jgi:hypothetical protein
METGQKMKPLLPSDVSVMFDEISVCLDDWSKSIPRPKHHELVDGWKDSMKHYIDTVAPEDEVAEAVTAGLLEAYVAWTAAQPITESPVDPSALQTGIRNSSVV